jgi:hypothetical protein
MSNLVINDLAVSKDLDRAAAMQIFGGSFLSALVARDKQPAVSSFLPGSISTVINNIDFNYNVYNNATLFNVYNGANNSGVIVNEFSALTLSAASPTLIGTPTAS